MEPESIIANFVILCGIGLLSSVTTAPLEAFLSLMGVHLIVGGIAYLCDTKN